MERKLRDESGVAELHQLYAARYARQGDGDKARVEYENALRLRPNNLRLLMNHASYLPSDADLERSIALYDQALTQVVEMDRMKIKPSFELGVAGLQLAQAYSVQGKKEKSWQAFKIAIENEHQHHLADLAKNMEDGLTAINQMPEFKQFLATIPEIEPEPETEVERNWRRHMERFKDEEERRQVEYDQRFSEIAKSFLAVEADGEIITGVILSPVGHVLVPAPQVIKAEVIRARIDNYEGANYQRVSAVAVDVVSGLAVVQVAGANYLRPVELGTVDDLREYTPFFYREANLNGSYYPSITVFTAHGRPLSPTDTHEQTGERATFRNASVAELEIDDTGRVKSLKVTGGETIDHTQDPWRPSPDLLANGDVLFGYDGKLLAFCLSDEVGQVTAGGSSHLTHELTPIDQIRAALERMNIKDHIANHVVAPVKPFALSIEAEDFLRRDGLITPIPSLLETDDETASGAACIVANPEIEGKYGEGSEDRWSLSLIYPVEIPEDGEYAIWIRGRGHDERSDSFFVLTDLQTTWFSDIGSYGKWVWVPVPAPMSRKTVPAFHFTKGQHEIRVYGCEARAELDAIFLTNSLDLQAEGVAEQFQSMK